MSTAVAVRPNISNASEHQMVRTGVTVSSGRGTFLNVVPVTQAYYWTRTWQSFESNASRDLRVGNVHAFDDAESALAWLDSID